MATEAVQVFVRCRPMNSREKELKSKKCIVVDKKLLQIEINRPSQGGLEPKAFTFDGVYDDDSQQKTVYADTAYRLVMSVIEGYNATMFAYGQTGCGKTHTMEGKPNPPSERGIIPNAFQHIFDAIDGNTIKGKKFLVKASYLEIYNEEVRDLLGDDPKARCEVKENKDGTYIKGLTVNVVKDSGAIANLMVQGNKNRSVGATLMNQTSSRSHSLFIVEVETAEPNEKTPDEAKIRVGKLNLVDLAGSERQDKTKAEGDRLKEATQINKSLSALGNVIAALVRGKVHIPYRDSKLTRLLQSSLGGNTKTIMMAAISPAEDNYDETLSTLRYANRAKNIKNKPKINEDPKDALLREYQDEIKKLKMMLEAQAKGVPIATLMAAAAAGGDKRGSVRLGKSGGDKDKLVVRDEEDEDLIDDDDGGSGGKSGGGAGARAGSASTRKKIDEAALRRAFEREKEWDETKAVLEALKTEGLPKLQKDHEGCEAAVKEAKAAVDQPGGKENKELTRTWERADARLKACAAHFAAEQDAYKKMDALDVSMSGAMKEMEANATARGSASGDKLKQLDSSAEELEQKANAIGSQMKQERFEYRKMSDMHVALARLAREKEESDRFEDERKRITEAAEKRRVEEMNREMTRLAKEKDEQDKKVKQLAEQMAAERSEKEKLAKLTAEKEKTEQLARDLADQMKREVEAQHKLTLEAKLARDKIEEENKERTRQSEELVKKIAEEKELHEKARVALAEKIKKQKEKHKEFAAAVADEKKSIALEKESLQSKLKALEDTLLEGDKKQKDAKLQTELQLRHAELLRQQKEAELARTKAKADEEKALIRDEYDAKVTDQSKLISRLRKKYKAALEEIKDLQTEYDEEKENLADQTRKLERDAQLRRQIITAFLTDKDYDKFVTGSKYDEANGRWILPSIEMAIVLPKIGGTLSEGVTGPRGEESDDMPHLPGMGGAGGGANSAANKKRREYDARWRQASRNRGRQAGLDPNNADYEPPSGNGNGGTRSNVHSRLGTASGNRDGMSDSRAGDRGHSANSSDNGRGLSIVASREGGRPPPAPHSAYIPRHNGSAHSSAANARKGSAGSHRHGADGDVLVEDLDGALGRANGRVSPRTPAVDLNNLPAGRANFAPAKLPSSAGPTTGGGGGNDALLSNLPKPKANFQPATGNSAANSNANSAQNSDDDGDVVVNRDAQHLMPNPPPRPKFDAHPPPVQVQPAPAHLHMPDARKRVFEPAKPTTPVASGDDRPPLHHPPNSPPKKASFQPGAAAAVSPQSASHRIDASAAAAAALSFEPNRRAFKPAGMMMPTHGDSDNKTQSGAGGVPSIPDVPKKASFAPAFGAGFGASAAHHEPAHSADPFAHIKAVPSKPSFQPGAFA